MSKINGDKARFHRERKKRIDRRARYKAMFGNAVKASDSASAVPEGKAKASKS
jgi:hypothetical protein